MNEAVTEPKIDTVKLERNKNVEHASKNISWLADRTHLCDLLSSRSKQHFVNDVKFYSQALTLTPKSIRLMCPTQLWVSRQSLGGLVCTISNGPNHKPYETYNLNLHCLESAQISRSPLLETERLMLARPEEQIYLLPTKKSNSFLLLLSLLELKVTTNIFLARNSCCGENAQHGGM